MRYVITGASGHIGNNLVRLINEKIPNAEVVVLTRRKIEKELNGAVCRQVIGNLQDVEFLKQNIQTGDCIVHMAGLIDLTDKKQNEMFAVNYTLTKNICDIALAANVKKLIYVGSVDAIYRTGEESAIAEPDDYFPQKIEGGYGRTKAMASKYVLDALKQNPQFQAAIVLPTAVLGMHDYKPSEAGKIIQKTLKGGAQFGIAGGYNFVDVLDVCNAILTLCESDMRGQYIVSGENVSVKELYQAINAYKGLKNKPIILPNWVAVLAIPFVKVLSKIMIKALQEPHNYSCEKAKVELGYTPTPFMKTLQNTVDWHEQNCKNTK